MAKMLRAQSSISQEKTRSVNAELPRERRKLRMAETSTGASSASALLSGEPGSG